METSDAFQRDYRKWCAKDAKFREAVKKKVAQFGRTRCTTSLYGSRCMGCGGCT